MIPNNYYRVIVITGFLLFLNLPVFAYEPTFNEIAIKKERLQTFCKQANNQRKFDICEKYKSLKGKLPDQISDYDIFKKTQNQPSKNPSP